MGQAESAGALKNLLRRAGGTAGAAHRDGWHHCQ